MNTKGEEQHAFIPCRRKSNELLTMIIGRLENIQSLDAKADSLRPKGKFVEENGRSLIEIQIEGII